MTAGRSSRQIRDDGSEEAGPGPTADRDGVQQAFDPFRVTYGPPRAPRYIRDETETRLMTPEEGLQTLVPASGSSRDRPRELGRMSGGALLAPVQLWVVRDDDVVHARLDCALTNALPKHEIKHPNLTGGAPAYCGGELLLLDNDTLIVNGQSGRYGPRSADEMQDVAEAFKHAGYVVYSMGYDQGAGRPFPFVGGPAPQLT